MPERIQRTRKKGGYKGQKPIYVGRPTKWGNPLKLMGGMIYIYAPYRRTVFNPWVFLRHAPGGIHDVVDLFEKLLHYKHFSDPDLIHWANHFQKLDLTELRGKNLSCWCRLYTPCHADILLKYANPAEIPKGDYNIHKRLGPMANLKPLKPLEKPLIHKGNLL